MDRNAKRRQRYAEMPPEKKDGLLRRRREANAAKKKNMALAPSGPGPTARLSKRKRGADVQEAASPGIHTGVRVSAGSDQPCSAYRANVGTSQCPPPKQSSFADPANVTLGGHRASLPGSVSIELLFLCLVFRLSYNCLL